MTRPVVIHSSDTIENAIRLMQANQVRSLVVEKCHEDGCHGILIEQDIVHKVVALGKDPQHVRVGSVMWQACTPVSLNATLQEAARALADAEISHAPVIEGHRLLGVISVTDILAHLGGADLSCGPELFWGRTQQPQSLEERTAQIMQRDQNALATFEDDMRYGCKTVF
ncbi:MAG: CBS domain-containing protein [Elainellaceae cyanobacterium]